MFRIQVKSKQVNEWPGIKGIYGKDFFLVLVDFKDRKENERPDFYILTVEDWVKLLKINLKDKIERGDVTIDRRNMPTWKGKYQGMGIKPEMIKEHRERWDKINKVVR
jgi:hypothetical protein